MYFAPAADSEGRMADRSEDKKSTPVELAAEKAFLFASLRQERGSNWGRDIVAGITLAAITIPEQMATARLGGFEPQVGFYAFIAATLGFAALGGNRVLTVGADSTITPLFAGLLASLVAAGTATLESASVALALLVGIMLIISGVFRLGWIAHLLSTPVVTGFIAGIAIHIVISQLPGLLGIAGTEGGIIQRVSGIIRHLSDINVWSAAIGIGVLVIMLLTERISSRIPGALIGLVVATFLSIMLNLESRGVQVIGSLPGGLPGLAFPAYEDWAQLVPLSLIIALIIMMQTAAVSHSFHSEGQAQNIDRDFLGIGASNLLASLFGSFPVNASPPRTGVVVAAGGTSQWASITAAGLVLLLALWGGSMLAHVPQAALAGVLMFVAQRIFNYRTIVNIARQSPAEGGLVLLTVIAIVLLPIQTGAAIGIGLSLLHGVAVYSQTRPIILHRLPGTTIWWPYNSDKREILSEGVLVIAFQAPLMFANADAFRTDVRHLIATSEPKPSLVVIEASSIVDIDYTAAQVLLEVIDYCRKLGIELAIARLESVRAQEAMKRFGILAELGSGHVFHSVDEAVKALAGMMP